MPSLLSEKKTRGAFLWLVLWSRPPSPLGSTACQSVILAGSRPWGFQYRQTRLLQPPVSMVQGCTPTLAYKEALYRDVHDLLQPMGFFKEFNARRAQDFKIRGGVLERPGIGRFNNNELLLHEFCSEHHQSSPTLCSSKKTGLRPPENSHPPNTGIPLNASSCAGASHTRGVMSIPDCYTHRGLVSSKVAFTFKPP